MARQQRRGAAALALAVLGAAALCVAAAAADSAQGSLEAAAGGAASSMRPGRRLLQPFNLGLPEATRRSGNVGNTGERRIIALGNVIASGAVDTSRKVNNTIRARTASTGETTNLDFAGAGKSTFGGTSESDEDSARTTTGVDVRSIGLPGPGLTASRAIDSSSSAASKRTKAAGAPRNASTLPRFTGPDQGVPAGEWEVLGAGAADYGWAGDYDYSLVRSVVDKRSFYGYRGVYDYDYGQPRIIPETAVVTTRTRSNLANDVGRAAGFGRIASTATAPHVVARSGVVSSGILGHNAAHFNDDLFGNAPTFVPPVPWRQTGSSAFGVGLAKTYKPALRPGVATNEANAGTTVSRNYISGGAADQLNYAAGTQAVAVRSQNVALGGEVNLDFDVGKRRRAARRLSRRHRRLHSASGAAPRQ